MQRVALAVFAKTVGLSPVKTRLQKDFGKEATERLYELFCECTRRVIDEAAALKGYTFTKYWSVPEQPALSKPLESSWQKIWQGPGESLGHKLDFVYELLLQRNDVVVLLGADAPHMPYKYLQEGIDRLALDDSDYVFGPAADGGFYFLAGRKAVPQNIWTSVTYSQNDTRERLRDLLVATNGSFSQDLPILEDVDTLEELKNMVFFCRTHAADLIAQQHELAEVVAQELFRHGAIN